MSIVRNNVRMTADQIIKLYLNGQYLHKDRELRDQLDAFLMPEVLRAEFLRAIRLLGVRLLDRTQRRRRGAGERPVARARRFRQRSRVAGGFPQLRSRWPRRGGLGPLARPQAPAANGCSLRDMAYQRPAPPAAELQQGADHLIYEVLMLSNAAALLEDDSKWNTGWGWQSKTLYMTTLESFLTHARSLMDFACPPADYETRRVHERGIFAADYCSKPWKPEPWPTLREEHKQISTEIEHLSFDRLVVGRKLAVRRDAEQTQSHASAVRSRGRSAVGPHQGPAAGGGGSLTAGTSQWRTRACQAWLSPTPPSRARSACRSDVVDDRPSSGRTIRVRARFGRSVWPDRDALRGC